MIVEQIWTANSGRNFNYLIACAETGEALAVDPLDHEKCLAAAKAKGWKITQILNTHEHRDHTGGNQQMIAATKAPVLAHANAKDKIPEMSRGLRAGDVIKIGIPAVNTNTLRVSTVTVIGASGVDPTLASEDSVGQCDYALGQVTTVRAQIGAQIVRLGIDETNDDTSATELVASHSNITDLNVGSATTEFTEQQIDIDVATSILTQVNNLPDTVLRLFQLQPPPP